MSMATRYAEAVQAQFDAQPLPQATVLTERDLAHLPAPVARYLHRTGSVGREVVHNFRVRFHATMYRPDGAPMESEAWQVEFIDRPARFFFLRTAMLGVPVRVLHDYHGGAAQMQVRLAGLFNLVDERGATLSRAETVTILNDLCVMAPSALVDRRFTWDALDAHHAIVHFHSGAHRVSAVMHFDQHGDLVNFVSDDRHALPDDGERWSTPLRDYRTFDGRRVAAEGDALWHYADGHQHRYGTFRILDIAWNVAPRTDELDPAAADAP